MENKSNLQDPQEIQNLDMTDAQLEGKIIELDKEAKKSRKKALKWLDGIEEKPKEIKGTPDVNIEPTSKRARFLRVAWSYLLITFGTALISAGIYFFKFPNHFTIGGVSSLAVILAEVFNGVVSESVIMTVLNTLLLGVALVIFGKKFAIKTIYSSMLLNAFVLVFEWLLPMKDKITGEYVPLTNEPFLEMLLTIAGIAIGSAILFSQGASSGGTDIIAMIFKRFTRVNIGTALMISDAVIVALSPLVFHDLDNYMTIFLCSATGLFLKSFIVDNVMDGINLNRCFIIVTSKQNEVCEFINEKLHRGATISDCEGAFSHEEKKMIITVLNRTQASILKQYLKQTDPHAFTIITNSSDIQGKGFRMV
jgi:uncharacterized membrane-anchored protein YitT (DUF2179 family)